MGQGRFVHPTRRRVITPHEAARIQMIPDYFDLSSIPGRTALAEAIGNAVPPKLAFTFAVELLR
jgi:DNA (cytosine-5)-methyltransferase 1